jgi:predicted RNase H-like HicB family nuclease
MKIMLSAYYGIFRPVDDEGWEGGFDVTFPDVPGAITVGHNLDESLSMAVEALSMILGSGRKGKDYRDPSSYEAILAQAEPGDRVFPVLPDSRLIVANSPKKRISLMLPSSQLSIIGSITNDVEGLDRSKFIAHAIDYYLAEKYPDAVSQSAEA